MDKKTFFENSEVQSFVAWLIDNLPKQEIGLKIKQSRFVPNGITETVDGFEKVLDHYMWKSAGTAGGGWVETKKCLTRLSDALRTAVNANDEGATFQACEDILVWGGNRNRKVGAYPFLEKLKNTNELCKYIRATGDKFLLASADEANLSPTVRRMNAMLTKVHALYASDGLPIYDSRVAAAIASLVELWRRATEKSGDELPPTLAFPATLTTRTVLRLFPDALHPGVMVYGARNTPQQWSSAKVRLGWIMEGVLTQSPNLVLPGQKASLADRMHAFEASLFMIGYDTACLAPFAITKNGTGSTPSVLPAYAKAIRTIRRGLTARFATMPRTDCETLVRPSPFQYSGNLDEGFVIWYPTSSVMVETGFIEEIQNTFGGGEPIPFGFDREGKNVPPNSFGLWIASQSSQFGRRLTGQNASHIAALMVNEGLAEKIGKTIRVF